MNRLPTLFAGFFLTFAFAWLGLVIIPYIQLEKLGPHESDDGTMLPLPPSGIAQQGAAIYGREGCIYCHSQQVRPANRGSDIARGWGTRATVARDYIYDRTVYLGTMRTGPDLANIGARQDSPEWHHKHLYSPETMSPGSIMPAYTYLYRVQKIGRFPSPDAIEFYKTDTKVAIPEGYEIVPTEEAKQLVAYLISLKKASYPLPEAPSE
ncbi:MAG: cbb3-type cytochrome c oxidase subunit II [Verrucomicrobiae bacterium]|nr:cbb3-type cytochrome c oxidase subunit II [Verrucomicrobiae bacterium]